MEYVTVSAEEGQSKDTFNSMVFHTDSAVDVGFAGSRNVAVGF
jgi:hypothetical protein